MAGPKKARWIIFPINALVIVQSVFDYQAHVSPRLNALGTFVLLISIDMAFFVDRRLALVLGNVALVWQFFFRDWLIKKESFFGSLLGGCIMLAVLNYNWFKPKADSTRA